MLADKVEQVARRHELCHNVEAVTIFEAFDKLEDVWAIMGGEFLHYFNLLEVLVVGLECAVNLTFAYNLDSDLHTGILVLREDDETEGSLTERA